MAHTVGALEVDQPALRVADLQFANQRSQSSPQGMDVVRVGSQTVRPLAKKQVAWSWWRLGVGGGQVIEQPGLLFSDEIDDLLFAQDRVRCDVDLALTVTEACHKRPLVPGLIGS